MFISKDYEIEKKNYSKTSIVLSLPALIIIGIPIGIISGFFGIGGGIIVVPFLNIFFNVPMLYAQGFSVSLIPFSSIGGLIGYISNGVDKIGLNYPYLGFVNLHIVFICGILSMIFTKMGLNIAKRINKTILKRIFATLLLFVSLKFIFT